MNRRETILIQWKRTSNKAMLLERIHGGNDYSSVLHIRNTNLRNKDTDFKMIPMIERMISTALVAVSRGC